LNRDSVAHPAPFTGLNAAPYNLPDNTVLVDALSGTTYTVSGGAVTPTVNASWGVILLEQAKIDTPQAPFVSLSADPSQITLSWSLVTKDTGNKPEAVTTYQVWRNTANNFAGATKIADVTPPNFGSANSIITFVDAPAHQNEARTNDYYYWIVAVSGSGAISAASNSVGASPTAVVLTGLSARSALPVGLGVALGVVLVLGGVSVVVWQGKKFI
ncbi:MAG TPA: hypothetical protein PK530_13180, partial [Anaerolineales bacterium]|nr:hypothetical protein [Anaerolineales bacterium]